MGTKRPDSLDGIYFIKILPPFLVIVFIPQYVRESV